jgi:hypothetical protein
MSGNANLHALALAASIVLTARSADANPTAEREADVEFGGGVDFTALGSFDVGESLGRMAERNDLGPATLGVFVTADVAVGSGVRLGGEAGIAIGGLVRTDERYFGNSSDIGSTLAVWLRGKVGWTALARPGKRVRLGGLLGIERLAEATPLGSVHLDSAVLGPWAALLIGRGVVAEVHADVHIPYRGNIGDQNGDPDGTFFGAGVRLAYVFGI